MERALTRFIAKTGDTEKLFEDDPYAFPRNQSTFLVILCLFLSQSLKFSQLLSWGNTRFAQLQVNIIKSFLTQSFILVIACKPSELPYIDALLPKDEDLEAQEMEEKKLNQQKQEQKQQLEESKEKDKDKDSDKSAENEQSKKEDDENKEKSPSKEEGQGQNEEGESSIDNPYLRPIKMPRLKGGKSTKSKW